jgi:hypothetical protein
MVIRAWELETNHKFEASLGKVSEKRPSSQKQNSKTKGHDSRGSTLV